MTSVCFEGGTEFSMSGASLDLHSGCKEGSLVNPGIITPSRAKISRATARNQTKQASKKNFSDYAYRNRTANRHRCSGRVDQDERMKDP